MANQTYGMDTVVGDGTKLVEGTTIYRIEVGALPASTTKNTAHGIAGIDLTKVVRFWGITTNGTLVQRLQQLSAPAATLTQFHLTATNVVIVTTADLSAYATTTVFIEMRP